MVKRLKLKFIMINMSIVGAIVISLFTFICIFTYNSQLNESFKFLELSLNREERGFAESTPSAPPPSNSSKEPAPSRPKNEFFELPNTFVFQVHLDKDRRVVSKDTKGEEIDNTLLKNAIDNVMEDSKEKGRVKGASLLFFKKEHGHGTSIAFTSSAPIDASIRNTIILSIILSLASIAVFFILSERLAYYAIKPVKNAWNSQRQFVADASHDLKTPLTVILANNDIMLSSKEKSIISLEKWLKSTQEEALKMKKLVEQMLELAKSESVQDKFELLPSNLSEATTKAVLQLEPVAFEKSIVINTYIEEEIIINTCIEAYEKILITLIDNAIKYSPLGEEIQISLKKEQQRVALIVSNKGYIEKKDIEHIFERFYRSDVSRSEGGYGLGLAIAKNLAEAIGAELGVRSEQNEGTTFFIILKKK